MENDKFLNKEKLLGIHRHRHFRLGLVLLVTFLIFDLIYLNLKLLGTKEIFFLNTANTGEIKTAVNPVPTGVLVVKNEEGCGEDCKAQILNILKEELSKTSGKTDSNLSAVKEYFIPFGSGIGNSTSWQDVAGLEATIDTSAYGKIKTVTFEASLRIPTANESVSVRLFNSTRGHQVWNSVLSYPGGPSSGLLVSKPITLDPGNNIYKVQIQTQLTYPAYIDQARIHVVTY